MWHRSIFRVAAAVLMACAARAACVGPAALEFKLRAHPDAAGFTALGEWFAAQRQYECAVASYRSALTHNPNSAHLLERLGSSLFLSGDAAGAIGPLRQSIALNPKLVGPHLKLAAALEQVAKREDAKTEWQSALKIDPKSIEALDGLSRDLIAEGNYGGVVDLLRGAPDDERLALDLAQAYGLAGMLPEASDTVTKALERNPSSFPLTYELAVVRVNQGLHEQAKTLMQKFAKDHPDELEAQKAYLRMLVINNDWSDALSLATRLLARAPNDDYVLFAAGMSERESGDSVAARKHLEQAVALNPAFSFSHYNLGLVLEQLHDPAHAKEQFEQAIALGFEEPDVHFQLANVLRSLGEKEDAEQQLKLYSTAMSAASTRRVADLKAGAAEKELKTGDPQKAVALYREALEATPNDALLSYKLSVALDRVGDTAGERSALEHSIQIDPDMAIAQNQLGYLDSRSGDAAAAEKHFREAVRSAPSYTEAWINLAATLGMESKFPEAKQAIDSALKLEPTNSEALQLRHDLAGAPSPH